MSAMSLEAEKNELIRRILDVDDVAILRRVKSMLSCEEEQTNVSRRGSSSLPDKGGDSGKLRSGV